jgi:hypothetical protein
LQLKKLKSLLFCLCSRVRKPASMTGYPEFDPLEVVPRNKDRVVMTRMTDCFSSKISSKLKGLCDDHLPPFSRSEIITRDIVWKMVVSDADNGGHVTRLL